MPPKKKSVTGAEMAIMSILAEQHSHGYQIEQIIEQRGMRDWTAIGFSSIYYILEKLEKIGWLQSRLDTSAWKGPARMIYALTASGRSAWEKAVLESLTHPKLFDSQFQLGLSNLLYFKKEVIICALSNYVTELTQKKGELEKKIAGYGQAAPWNVTAMFDLSQAQLRTNIAWTQTLIKQIGDLGD